MPVAGCLGTISNLLRPQLIGAIAGCRAGVPAAFCAPEDPSPTITSICSALTGRPAVTLLARPKETQAEPALPRHPGTALPWPDGSCQAPAPIHHQSGPSSAGLSG